MDGHRHCAVAFLDVKTGAVGGALAKLGHSNDVMEISPGIR